MRSPPSPKSAYIAQNRYGAVNEIYESRVARAVNPPKNPEGDENDDRVTAEGMKAEIFDAQLVGDEGANNRNHQAPVEHPDRPIPDEAIGRAVGGAGWRYALVIYRSHGHGLSYTSMHET
jgi:hypothetical protein